MWGCTGDSHALAAMRVRVLCAHAYEYGRVRVRRCARVTHKHVCERGRHVSSHETSDVQRTVSGLSLSHGALPVGTAARLVQTGATLARAGSVCFFALFWVLLLSRWLRSQRSPPLRRRRGARWAPSAFASAFLLEMTTQCVLLRDYVRRRRFDFSQRRGSAPAREVPRD